MKNRPNSLAVRAVFHIPKNAVLHAKLPKTGKNGAQNPKKTGKNHPTNTRKTPFPPPRNYDRVKQREKKCNIVQYHAIK